MKNFENINSLIEVKVDLHSICVLSAFVHFFTFLLLCEQVCPFSSAFLYVHIRTNQTVMYWTKVFQKSFLQRGTKPYFEMSLLS